MLHNIFTIVIVIIFNGEDKVLLLIDSPKKITIFIINPVLLVGCFVLINRNYVRNCTRIYQTIFQLILEEANSMLFLSFNNNLYIGIQTFIVLPLVILSNDWLSLLIYCLCKRPLSLGWPDVIVAPSTK